MAEKEVKVICDFCQLIMKNNEGLRIMGNLYSVNNDSILMQGFMQESLIGNNITVKPSTTSTDVSIRSIKVTDICPSCFVNLIPEEFKEKCKKYLVGSK